MNKGQTTITLKVSDDTKKQMIDYFEDLKRIKTPPYAVFQADDGGTVVTLYESGKVVFQGFDADLAADFCIETEKINSGSASVTNSNDKKKDEKKENDKDGKVIRQERYFGSASRNFYVGDVTEEEVKARFDNGVLHLDVPKKENALPEKKMIAIEGPKEEEKE